jgi:hypothetical protein
MSHPIETLLLPRLEGVRKAGKRGGVIAAWRACCPLHNAKNDDLSIAITPDGLPLMHCFCRHAPVEVFDALGIDWTDLHPHSFNPNMPNAMRGNGGPGAWLSVAALTDALLKAHADLLSQIQISEFVGGAEKMIEAGRIAGDLKRAAREAMRGAK